MANPERAMLRTSTGMVKRFQRLFKVDVLLSRGLADTTSDDVRGGFQGLSSLGELSRTKV
jgi:hypothetical protein